MRIKEICDYVSRGSTPDYIDESPYKVMNQASFSKGYIDESKQRFTSKISQGANIRKGDLLMASTGGGVLGKVFYFDSDDESFYAVYYITLEKIRTLYAKINGIIDLPIMKIEKIYNDKEFAKKYIASSSHSLPSQEFIDLYLECIKLDNRNIMLCNLKRLYGYSFGNLDFDPKCFCLRFQKKSPFRV